MCPTHGGSIMRVREKAIERSELAELLARNPRRHPGEVMLDALHYADSIMQRVVLTEGPVTAMQLIEAAEAVERACRFAKIALDTQARELAYAAAPRFTAEAVEAEIRRVEAELGDRALPGGDDDWPG